jgi:septum formation protein
MHPIKVLLASKSPRRKKLLQRLVPAGQIIIISSEISEDRKKGERAVTYCKRIAEEKVTSVWRKYRGQRSIIAAVIGADTVIQFRNEIIGQPNDPSDAARILKKLAGNSHKVITGVMVFFPVSARRVIFAVKSKVWMRSMSDEVIGDYVATMEPLDKAGAYAIQGMGRKLVARYEGSFTNIVGLPIDELKTILDKRLS